MAYMQVAIGLWRKTGHNRFIPACCQVSFHNFFKKIERFLFFLFNLSHNNVRSLTGSKFTVLQAVSQRESMLEPALGILFNILTSHTCTAAINSAMASCEVRGTYKLFGFSMLCIFGSYANGTINTKRILNFLRRLDFLSTEFKISNMTVKEIMTTLAAKG